MLVRPAADSPVAYDFLETAPAGASPGMFVVDGEYDRTRHHAGHRAVGVPGAVAALYQAWSEHGRLPWRQLVTPAIALARDGFVVSQDLDESLADVLPQMVSYPASIAPFSRDGRAYEPGDVLRQVDLAKTLELIGEHGPDGFYQGRTAELIEQDMAANGGLITRVNFAEYQAVRRRPVLGTYRGYGIISMPPISCRWCWGDPNAQHPRRVRSGFLRLWISANGAPDGRSDAAGVCGPCPIPGGSGVQSAHADRTFPLEDVRAVVAPDNPDGSRLRVIAGVIRVAGGG